MKLKITLKHNLINPVSVILLLLLATIILFISSFSISSLVFFWTLFIILYVMIKHDKILILFCFIIGIMFMIALYHYWITFYDNSYFLGIKSDDWQYDILWTEGYISKYGISTSGLFDHLNDIKPNLGILHNSKAYVMFIIYVRYFASFIDGYHTLLPRILNIFFLILTAYYSSIIAFVQTKSVRVRRLTFLLIFFYPVLLFNSSHIFRDIIISFILIYTYYLLTINKYSFSTVIKILLLLFVLFFLRLSTFLVCSLMILIMYSNVNKINFKLFLVIAFFGILSSIYLISFFESALVQINNYTSLNSQRFGTIGSSIMSLPIHLGLIPRLIFLIFTPVPNFSSLHQIFVSTAAFIQVFSFPYLIFGFKQKDIDFNLKIIFLLFFFGVAFTSADFRHVMMFLPFGIILTVISYCKKEKKGVITKQYLLLLGLLIILFILSIGLSLYY